MTEEQFKRLLELAYVAQGCRKDDREVVRQYDSRGHRDTLLGRTQLATTAIIKEIEAA